MKIDELLARLPEGSVSRTALADIDSEVFSVSFLTGWDARNLRSDMLYFADSTLLPKAVDEHRMFNCIIADADGKTDLEGEPNVNLIWLSPDANLYACYNEIQSAFLEDQELTSVIRRLLAAHFSNHGLQYLVEEAASSLGNPIVVVDPSYRYIAYHLGIDPEDDSPSANAMRAEIANETVLDDAVAYIRDSRIDAEIARSKGPYVHFNDILGRNTMTLAVMVRGICMAHVMMVEYNRPFNELDREVFVRLSNFVGQELQKGEVWGPTSGELGSFFLENLLNDANPSTAVLSRRLKALNFHPKPLLFVVCLHAPGEGLTQVQTERIAAQLKPVFHHSLYTTHHKQLVAVLSRDVEEGISPRTEQKLRDVAALNSLSVGISNAYRELAETRLAYQQARAAIRYGEMNANALDDGKFFRYADYSFTHMLSIAGRRTNLLELCHPALLELMEYDESHGGELMETLFCYLQVAGSTSRASALLSLHKNTMLYRLGRIREVTGMDLSSGEQIFQLQAGFRILLYLGLFQTRLNLTRADLIDGK